MGWEGGLSEFGGGVSERESEGVGPHRTRLPTTELTDRGTSGR